MRVFCIYNDLSNTTDEIRFTEYSGNDRDKVSLLILDGKGGFDSMTLTQLRYAITVANANSMNEAARMLFVSQPSLSSAIKELEEEIGVEIFRRTNRGISLTPEGE